MGMFKAITIAAIMAVVIMTLSMVKAEEESVVTLTDSTFHDFVKSNEFVLAEFYAPWCGHCKQLAPEYEKAAKALKAQGVKNVVLAKIDATAEKTLAEEFEIGGFPTLKWFVNGQAKEYTGGREEETILQWIKKKTGPPAVKVSSIDQLEKLKKENEVFVLGLFSSDAEAASFLSVAADIESAAFGIAVGSAEVDAIKAAAGATSGAPAIILFKHFDEGKAVYSGSTSDIPAIDKFVNGNSLPLVVPFSQDNAQKIFGGGVKQHLLIFVDKSKSGESEKIVESATPVAKEYRGEYLFVTVDKTDSRIVEFFGVGDNEYPTARIVLIGDESMKKFKIQSKEVTEATLSAFIKAHKAGELLVDLKSEDIPASQSEPVFVLVAKQYEEIVKKDGHKNVLLEVYAPWCGHCKKLAPIYDELAKKYKKFDNLIIAKMDGTLNEVEDLNIEGFPTLKFFPAGSNEIVDYDGARDLEGLSSFLEEKIPGLKESATSATS